MWEIIETCRCIHAYFDWIIINIDSYRYVALYHSKTIVVNVTYIPIVSEHYRITTPISCNNETHHFPTTISTQNWFVILICLIMQLRCQFVDAMMPLVIGWNFFKILYEICILIPSPYLIYIGFISSIRRIATHLSNWMTTWIAQMIIDIYYLQTYNMVQYNIMYEIISKKQPDYTWQIIHHTICTWIIHQSKSFKKNH